MRKIEPNSIEATKTTIGITTRVGAAGGFHVDLPLFAGDLNERLLQIGIWFVERSIPHQARIIMEPEHERVRIAFPKADDAEAFRERFGARMN